MKQIAAVLAIVLVACGRPATVVTVKLVDPRPVQSPDSTDRVYLVEVRSEPLSLLDRIRAGRGEDHPDTIPGIRVLSRPVAVDDSVVVGFWTMGAGGTPAGTFTYDLATRKVNRGRLPVWIQDMADFSHAALSPDIRHIAYVVLTPEGEQYGIVRHWPDGNVVTRGPAGRRWTYRSPGRAHWADNERVSISYDAALGPEPVRFVLHANVRDPRQDRVDTLGVEGPLRSELAAAESARVVAAAEPPAPPPVPPPPPAPKPVWPPQPDTNDAWSRAARGIKRLFPDAFIAAPEAFRQELARLGCTIPQAEEWQSAPGPHNVIHGHFGSPDQDDWAALCSRSGFSVILVHWGGPARCPGEFAGSEDKGFLQGMGRGRIAYSRGIGVRNHYHHYPDESDTTVTEGEVTLEHDGIEDAFLGKASSVWLCRDGKWIRFSGAD